MIIAQVHESIVHLNDDFELVLGDKELHFILMAVLGMLLFSSGWPNGASRPFRLSMCSP